MTVVPFSQPFPGFSALAGRSRPTVGLGLAIGLAAVGLVVVAIDLTRPSPSRAEAESLTRTLGLTDLALVTEARYLRHVSLADLHSAFQDHPVALEHFPAGALIAPPAHLRPAPAQPPQTVDHARLD